MLFAMSGTGKNIEPFKQDCEITIFEDVMIERNFFVTSSISL